MRERNTQPMAVLWDRWRGIRLGEVRAPGPFDLDDPDAQGNSGDDWQWVDAASSMLPDGSFGAAGFVRRAGGVEHVVREEYFSCFHLRKLGAGAVYH